MRAKAGKNAGRVIPGFGLSLGVTLAMVGIVVLIPMASLVLNVSRLEPAEFFRLITATRTLMAFKVSFFCAFIAAAVNLVMGVLLAWVLTRYDFPAKRLMNGLIELPLALPTAVAGIALTSLTSDAGWVGAVLARAGIAIAYTPTGITVALIFIGIPFVARSVQPVLEKLDPACEEAAALQGSGRLRTFFRVILPELRPAALTGFGLAFARGLGEYGSVVFIAGNQPFKTEIVPLLIMNQLQEFDYAEASAIALVMLAVAFLILMGMKIIESRAAKRTNA